jgi:5-methyltetrahydrofolate--homocysteine methyltransferase
MFDSKNLMEAVMQGDGDQVALLVKKSLDLGVSAGEILNRGLISAMDIVGERMENEDMFIPEVLMAAQAMACGVEIIKPLLAEGESAVAGRAIIGTVKGDLHDIGKNLVSMMLESSGLEVHNLGVDVAPERFVAAIGEKKAGLVCLSALLTTTMPMMKKTIEAIKAAGLRASVKILVGGAPVTQAFADEIGADGFASDAGSAVKLAKRLI